MKIVVVFDLPDISDTNSNEVAFAIDSISEDIGSTNVGQKYDWYIDTFTD